MIRLSNEEASSWIIKRYEILTYGLIQDLKITGRTTRYLSISSEIVKAIKEDFNEDFEHLIYIPTYVTTSEGEHQIVFDIKQNRRKIKK